jgi:hypothetical protein
MRRRRCALSPWKEALDESIGGLASPRRVRRVFGIDCAQSIAEAMLARAGRLGRRRF